jgi:hypothetical protein
MNYHSFRQEIIQKCGDSFRIKTIAARTSIFYPLNFQDVSFLTLFSLNRWQAAAILGKFHGIGQWRGICWRLNLLKHIKYPSLFIISISLNAICLT